MVIENFNFVSTADFLEYLEGKESGIKALK